MKMDITTFYLIDPELCTIYAGHYDTIAHAKHEHVIVQRVHK